jgi:FAD/FMN-containing dehydrogenase
MDLNRRDFVKGGLAAGAAAAIPGIAFPTGSMAGAAEGVPWSDLADELSGELVLPGDGPYLGLATPQALRYLRDSPRGIVVCASAGDASAAVKFARENDLPVRVRGGGHSYAGYSTTPGIQIDMSGMREVSFDSSTGLADFGGGARGVEEAGGLEPHGVFIPSGSCTGVGLAGFAQGGGFGHYANRHGLGCDNLEEAEVVTANGEVVTASGTRNSDLFWAIRGGGGGNFGVVTRTRLRTFPTAEPVSVANIVWRGPGAAKIIAELLPAIESSPDSMSFQLTCDATSPYNITGSSTPEVTLHGHNFGPAREIEDLFEAVIKKREPAIELVADLSFWQGHTFFNSVGLPDSGLWSVKSLFIPEPVSRSAIDTIVEAAATWPGSSIGMSGVGLTRWSGAITKPGPEDTAFVHRDDGYLVTIQTSWGGDDPPDLILSGKDWAKRLYEDLLPSSTGGSYQNWIDPELKDPLEAYYGANLQRLKNVKRRVDPDDFFSIPQGIPVGRS